MWLAAGNAPLELPTGAIRVEWQPECYEGTACWDVRMQASASPQQVFNRAFRTGPTIQDGRSCPSAALFGVAIDLRVRGNTAVLNARDKDRPGCCACKPTGLGLRMKDRSPSTVRQHLLLFEGPFGRAAIALLILSSVFQGMSMFALRLVPRFEVGIAPYWAFAALVVLAALPSLAGGEEGAVSRWPNPMRWAAFSLAFFALYGAISAFSLPFVFHDIAVLDPRLGIADQFMDPSSLQWSLSNAGQAGYILLNCAVFWVLILGVRTHQNLRDVESFILAAGWLVLGFALFQRVSTAYLPNQLYPAIYAFTHNNPAASSYPVMDPRTTSFFLEPSFLAGFAAMLFAMGLNQYFFAGRLRSLVLGMVAAYVILSSESTIGLALVPIATLLALLPSVGTDGSATEDGQRLGKRSRIRNALLGLFCVILLFSSEQVAAEWLRPLRGPTPPPSREAASVQPSAAATALPGPASAPTAVSAQPNLLPPTPGSSGAAQGLVDLGSRPWAVRLLSLQYRLWADQFSVFEVTKATLFFGAGLGSNRPSSFLAYVVSNTGIPGLLAVGSFFVLLVVSWLRYRRSLTPSAVTLCAGMSTYMLALFAGLPDPSWPPFLWILGGTVLAGLRLAAVPAKALPVSSAE